MPAISIRRPRFLLFAVLLAACACGANAKLVPSEPAATAEPAAKIAASILSGTLLGHDGMPMAMAHVTVAGEARQVASDGSFRIELPKAGLYRAQFTGVDQGDHTASLLVEAGEVSLVAKLGTYQAAAPIDDLKVVELVFDDKGNGALGKVVPMHKDADGLFRAEVQPTGSEFAYEIRGMAVNTGRSMNGTARTAFRYDGDGNYANVVKTQGAALVVEYDPSKSSLSGVPTTLVFAKPESSAARIAEIFTSKPAGSVATQISAAQAEDDVLVRQARALAIFSGMALQQSEPPSAALVELAQQTLKETPADSPLWAAAPGSSARMSSIAGEAYAKYSDALVARFVNEGESETAALLTFNLLMHAAARNDEAALKRYYASLKSEFSTSSAARMAEMFSPARKIRIGKQIPNFTLSNVDTSAELSNASFAGKVVLIDFWATWCKPCMSEMPNLHATYKEFHEHGFEILSVNVDDQPGSAQAMRKKGQFPMPWNNVVLDKEAASQVKRDFEVSGLPTMILVGPKGTILAANMSLRGEGLRRHLREVLPISQ